MAASVNSDSINVTGTVLPEVNRHVLLNYAKLSGVQGWGAQGRGHTRRPSLS